MASNWYYSTTLVMRFYLKREFHYNQLVYSLICRKDEFIILNCQIKIFGIELHPIKLTMKFNMPLILFETQVANDNQFIDFIIF